MGSYERSSKLKLVNRDGGCPLRRSMKNRISWYWNKPLTGFGTAVFAVSVAIAALNELPGLWKLVGLGVAGGLGYYAIACFANSMVIERIGGELVARDEPLPMWRARRFPVDEVMRVETGQVLAPEYASETWFAPPLQHRVQLTLRDGRTVVLASAPEDDGGSGIVARKVAEMCGIEKRE